MAKYEIRGGKPLEGTVTISGAKNAVVAILPAALLVEGVCRIENVPNISDVRILLDMLEDLGNGGVGLRNLPLTDTPLAIVFG